MNRPRPPPCAIRLTYGDKSGQFYPPSDSQDDRLDFKRNVRAALGVETEHFDIRDEGGVSLTIGVLAHHGGNYTVHPHENAVPAGNKKAGDKKAGNRKTFRFHQV